MAGTYETFCKEDRKRELVKELIELIGEENTLKITKAYGGETVYIPKCEKSLLQARAYEIYSQYLAGTCIKALGKRYGLSEKTIRNIVYDTENETQALIDSDRNNRIRTDYKNGMPIMHISRKYKLSVTFIRTIIENDKL
ncbi:MAG: hypothetical protein K2H01_04105 [Ruminococcus sp.]|nr:hypothetical protein [Ruminococcus sp.]